MKTTPTEADILRYIYGETSAQENKWIEDGLKQSAHLKIYYTRMMETVAELDTIEGFEPDQTSINIIMESSASHQSSLEHL